MNAVFPLPRHAKTATPAFIGVDFFCGAGGTTRGMIDAGGHVIAGVDKAENCRQTYERNNINGTLDGAPAKFLNRDIFAASDEYPHGEKAELIADLRSMIAKASATAPDVPLMFAICAPCQPFTGLSRKTLSKGREEARVRDRNLLLEAGGMVAEFMPDIVISENVAGIRHDKFGNVWEEFAGRLGELGYAVGTRVVSTDRFGVPQVRRRSILVAVRKDRMAAGVDTIEIPDHDPQAMPMTVRQAIGHFPPLSHDETHPTIPNHRTTRLTPVNLRRISHAKPGETNDYLWDVNGEDLSLACHKKARERTGGVHKTFTDVYTRLHPDGPAPTITTNCNSFSNGRFGHFDPEQNRGLSLREAAALQSFRDDYVFVPEDRMGAVARMIGNAVPPRLAEFFSRFSISLLETGTRSHPA